GGGGRVTSGARTAPTTSPAKTGVAASTRRWGGAAKPALTRLFSGAARGRAASSPRHKIAMRPRRAVGLDTENGSEFIIVLLFARAREPRAGLGRGTVCETPGACDAPALDT